MAIELTQEQRKMLNTAMKEPLTYSEDQLLQISSKKRDFKNIPQCENVGNSERVLYIYKITNVVNDRYYIGKHLGRIDDTYLGSGYIIRQEIKKFGRIAFVREIIALADNPDHADELEEQFIDPVIDDPMTYNIARGGKDENLMFNAEARYRKFLVDRSEQQLSLQMSLLKKIYEKKEVYMAYVFSEAEKALIREIFAGLKCCTEADIEKKIFDHDIRPILSRTFKPFWGRHDDPYSNIEKKLIREMVKDLPNAKEYYELKLVEKLIEPIMSLLRRGKYSDPPTSLTEEEKERLWLIVKKLPNSEEYYNNLLQKREKSIIDWYESEKYGEFVKSLKAKGEHYSQLELYYLWKAEKEKQKTLTESETQCSR